MDYRELSNNITYQQTNCSVIGRKLWVKKLQWPIGKESKEASLQKCKEVEFELSEYD